MAYFLSWNCHLKIINWKFELNRCLLNQINLFTLNSKERLSSRVCLILYYCKSLWDTLIFFFYKWKENVNIKADQKIVIKTLKTITYFYRNFAPIYFNFKKYLDSVFDALCQLWMFQLFVVVDDVHHLLLQVLAEHVKGHLII